MRRFLIPIGSAAVLWGLGTAASGAGLRGEIVFTLYLSAAAAATYLSPSGKVKSLLGFLVLAPLILLGLLGIGITWMSGRGTPGPSVASRSPDGLWEARLVRAPAFIDFNFGLYRRRTRWGPLGEWEVLFISEDLGPNSMPDGTERLLWSADGNHLLMVSPKRFGWREAGSGVNGDLGCLADGNRLNVLISLTTRSVRYNGDQTRLSGISVDDVSGLGFGENFKPCPKAAGNKKPSP